MFQFDSDEDKIKLKNIDADTDRGEDQSFEFSQNPSANSVWIKDIGKLLVVKGDVDGDAQADFAIQVMGIDSLLEDDFIL